LFTLKALREIADLELGLDPDDVCDVLAGLQRSDLAERIQSQVRGEWMYIFKPQLEGVVVYVKVILRDDCLVVSFHEDEESDVEEAR
jgi:hypothetical protein